MNPNSAFVFKEPQAVKSTNNSSVRKSINPRDSTFSIPDFNPINPQGTSNISPYLMDNNKFVPR